MDKLKIVSLKSSGIPASTFIATLSPNTIKHDLGIRYTNGQCQHKQALGTTAPKTQFESYESEKLSFEILLDGTGVVEHRLPGLNNLPGLMEKMLVTAQLALLKKTTYSYNGEEHEPLPVLIHWGTTLCFKGRLTAMGVSYTLFDTNGIPLRAKVSLQFTKFITEKEQQAANKTSSPDLTHIVEFKAGDTLPQLCQKIYKDCSYYADVAKANNLPSIRNIPPGTRLYFPPLV